MARFVIFNALYQTLHQNESEGICRTHKKIFFKYRNHAKSRRLLTVINSIFSQMGLVAFALPRRRNRWGPRWARRADPGDTTTRCCAPNQQPGILRCVSVFLKMKTPGVNQQPITEKRPSEPVVSCSKDPGMGVESQEQGRYARWHTEVLEGI